MVLDCTMDATFPPVGPLSSGTGRGGILFYLVTELARDTVDDVRAAFASQQGQATAADVGELAAGVGVRSMIFEVEELL
jgi:hypothetical protein